MTDTEAIALRANDQPEGPWIRPWGAMHVENPWDGKLDTQRVLDFACAARTDIPELLARVRAFSDVRQFIALHREATGATEISVEKVLTLLDQAMEGDEP